MHPDPEACPGLAAAAAVPGRAGSGADGAAVLPRAAHRQVLPPALATGSWAWLRAHSRSSQCPKRSFYERAIQVLFPFPLDCSYELNVFKLFSWYERSTPAVFQRCLPDSQEACLHVSSVLS